MSLKRIFLSGFLIFLAHGAMAVLVHGVWLGASYSSLIGSVWRSQEELTANAWIMQGTSLVFSLIFVYLFDRGYRGGGWKEGAWFGFVAYFFVGFQAVFHAYATYPLPLDLALKWFFSGLLIFIILGVLTSLLYRKKQTVNLSH